MNIEVVLFSGILDLSVFHESKWQEGELGKGILSAVPNPHLVALEIHKRYSHHPIKSITLSAPQSRLDIPKDFRNNFYGVYPELLAQTVQEYLSTLFPQNVEIHHAEC